MTLGDYIKALQAIEAAEGPLVSVEKWMPAKGRHEAPPPVLANARRYERGRAPAFYSEGHDNPTQKGQVVVRV